MPLSGRQRAALEHLDWLLAPGDNSRRSGRTYVMAVALIRAAVRNPGQRVYYIDHHETMGVGRRDVQHYMANMIQDFVRADPRLNLAYQNRDYFVLGPSSVPIENWEPLDNREFFNPDGMLWNPATRTWVDARAAQEEDRASRAAAAALDLGQPILRVRIPRQRPKPMLSWLKQLMRD